ncbi:MAG: hypothetical protein JXQ93_08750 [Flavobacteriaceae bacterium]
MSTFIPMNFKKLHIVILLFFNSISYSQSIDDVIDEAETLFLKTRKVLVFPNNFIAKNEIDFYYPIKNNRNINLLNTELKEWESKQYKKDIGLVFKATANYNFRDAIEEETNNYLKGSVRTELEWNVLKMGYFYNRFKSRRLQNDIEVLKLERLGAEKQLWRRQFRIDYNYVLNKEAIQLFEKFEVFENNYFDVLNKLYYQKLIKREKLIKASNQILVLKTQIKTIKKENIILKDSVSNVFHKLEKLPIMKIELDSILLAKESGKLFYKENNIKLQHQPLNDLNLSFYATQNYNYSTNTHKFFPSVGIRFRAPIRFNHRKKIIETKIKILKAQESDVSVGKYNSSLTYINEYNEKLKDLQNQYKSWQILEERIRILKVLKLELNSMETGLLLLDLMEEQFKVLENTLQLKRQMYKVITRLFQLNESIDFQDFFTPFVFEKKENIEVVCLEKSKKYSLPFQLAFLKAKKINSVTVLSTDIEIQKLLRNEKIAFVIVDSKKGISLESYIEQEVQRIKI